MPCTIRPQCFHGGAVEVGREREACHPPRSAEPSPPSAVTHESITVFRYYDGLKSRVNRECGRHGSLPDVHGSSRSLRAPDKQMENSSVQARSMHVPMLEKAEDGRETLAPPWCPVCWRRFEVTRHGMSRVDGATSPPVLHLFAVAMIPRSRQPDVAAHRHGSEAQASR